MKRLLTGALALILSIAASATTFTPIQLLNPTGSTSGQAIVSTGASTVPAWSNVAATTLASQAANTVVANVTGSAASPTAFAMPSCSTSASALIWTSGAGFACNAAILGGTNAGAFTTLAASGTISPSQTAGIVGTTTNNSANAGSIGEYPTPGSTTGTSLTTATLANCASLSLSAGDWDVQGNVKFIAAGSTIPTAFYAGLSATSATLGTDDTITELSATFATGQTQRIPTPIIRFSLASTATVFLVAQSVFTVSTMTCNGFIRARRVR